jgi:hypothetical protein
LIACLVTFPYPLLLTSAQDIIDPVLGPFLTEQTDSIFGVGCRFRGEKYVFSSVLATLKLRFNVGSPAM